MTSKPRQETAAYSIMPWRKKFLKLLWNLLPCNMGKRVEYAKHSKHTRSPFSPGCPSSPWGPYRWNINEIGKVNYICGLICFCKTYIEHRTYLWTRGSSQSLVTLLASITSSTLFSRGSLGTSLTLKMWTFYAVTSVGNEFRGNTSTRVFIWSTQRMFLHLNTNLVSLFTSSTFRSWLTTFTLNNIYILIPVKSIPCSASRP
jgi:hypothetical protein